MSLKSELLDRLQFKTHKISIFAMIMKSFWQVRLNVPKTSQGPSTVFYSANFMQEFCMKSRYSGFLKSLFNDMRTLQNLIFKHKIFNFAKFSLAK